jgi:hypothetical protein
MFGQGAYAARHQTPARLDHGDLPRRSDWTSRLGNPCSTYVRSPLAVTVPWVASE